jgi:hypothetical protein
MGPAGKQALGSAALLAVVVVGVLLQLREMR